MKWEKLFVSQELQMWGYCKTFEVRSDECNANTIWPSILHSLQTYNKIIPHFLILHIYFAFKTLTEVHVQLMAWVAMAVYALSLAHVCSLLIIMLTTILPGSVSLSNLFLPFQSTL
jgi:hypothetical protein